MRTFFGSDWLEKPLECLLQWVTVKEENTRSITASTSPDLTSPDLASPDLRSPDLTSPDLTSPDLRSPDLASPDFTSPDLTPALEPIAGHMLSLLIEMHGFERCEALVKQFLAKTTGDALYQLLAFCYR